MASDKFKTIFNPLSGNFDTVQNVDDLTTGAASTSDNTIPRFDGTTGKLLQSSSVTIDDTGKLTLGADGTSSLDAVTKQQLDAAIGGVDIKEGVRAASTANLTLSGEQTVDGIALVTGDRILVKNQSVQTGNGIYVVSTGAWTRATDSDTASELNGALVTVKEGSTQANTGWYQTTELVTLGSDNVIFTQFFGAGTYVADGNGIELSGSTFSLELDGSTLSKSATGVKVATSGITSNELGTNSVTTAKITDSNVTAAKIATNAVTNTKIQDGAVTSSKLGTNSVTTVKITDANVTEAKLATNAVTTTKIADANVTATKLATDSVTTAKILNANVTTAKIADANVTDAKIATGINAAKLADGSVSNTEFQYINSLTSNAQTQLDAKLDDTQLDTDIELGDASPSDTQIPSQKAVKSYVDVQAKKNYISMNDSSFEVDTGNWATFDDSSAYIDGTGGVSANLTLTRITTASNVLSGIASASLAKGAANAQYEGVSVSTLTIDRKDRGKSLIGKLSIDTSDANYASGDLRIFAYDITNSAELLVESVFDADNDIPSGGIHNLVFKITPTDNTTAQIRLSLMVNSTNATAWTVYYDSVSIGPDSFTSGAIVGEWQSYTPTGSWTTNTIYSGRWRRVGDSMELEVGLDLSGAPNATDLSIDLPSGYLIDTNKVSFPAANESIFGSANIYDSVTRLYTGNVVYSDTNSLKVTHSESGNIGVVNATNPITFAANDNVNIRATVPIQGWDASTIISTTDSFFKSAKVDSGGNGGESITANVTNLTFTEIRDITNAWNGTEFTAASTGYYDFVGQVAVSSSGNYLIDSYIDTGSGYAVDKRLGVIVSSTVGGFSGSLYLQKGDKVALRLNASATLAGSAASHWLTIKANSDLTTFGVYKEESEINTEITSSTATVSADDYVDVSGSSITLPVGKWRVHINGSVLMENASGGALNLQGNLVLTDSSNNIVSRSNMYFQAILDGTADQITSPISRSITITVSEEATYKLRLRCSVAVASGRLVFVGGANPTGGLTDPENYSEIWAERIY